MTDRLAPLLLTLALAAGCGAPEVVTPEPLRIVDTYPSNGALVAAGDVPIVVVLSADPDEDTLAEAVLLEEVSEAGTPIAVVPTALSEYLAESHSATYTAPPLPAGRAFSLTIFQEVLRADDGRALLSDFVRRFKTGP